MANFINTFNGLVWATPLIALTFGGALLYTIILKFSNIKNVRLQWKLLKSCDRYKMKKYRIAIRKGC